MIIQALQEKLDRYLTYLEQDKNNPNLLKAIGLLEAQILHHQQHIPQAISLLESLLIDNPSCSEITGLLSLLHFDNQDAIKATTLAQKALSLEPSCYEALLVNVLLNALQNNITLEEINELITIRPQDSRLWFIVGTTQMAQMNYPAAEQAFAQATTIYPHFYDSWICSGWCHLLQNNLEKAQLCYQKAKTIDPEVADGIAGLALVHALQHNSTEAKKALKMSGALDPDCFLAAITRIIIATESNPEEAAIQFNATFPDIADEINSILNLTTRT